MSKELTTAEQLDWIAEHFKYWNHSQNNEFCTFRLALVHYPGEEMWGTRQGHAYGMMRQDKEACNEEWYFTQQACMPLGLGATAAEAIKKFYERVQKDQQWIPTEEDKNVIP